MDTLFSVLSIILVILGIWILIKIFTAPIRLIFKILINAALGFVMLFVVNLVGSLFGFSVTVNLFTSLIAGVFGVPGIAAIVLFHIIF